MREARLKPLLTSLEEDFDTLRDGLIDELTHYEGELKKHCQTLPQWLALDFKTVWPLLRFEEDSIAPQGALGPRVVAVAAGWLEEHLLTWLGENNHPVVIQFTDDPQRVTSYKQAHADVKNELEQLLLLSEHVAQGAKITWSQWRDDILAELEQQRVEDIDAIETLVAAGDLGPGRDARQEIALLWEDQRHMASSLLKQWEPIEQLISQGLELTRDGIEHLQDLLEHIHEGMQDVYPPLQDDYTGHSIIPTSSKTDPFDLANDGPEPNVQPEHLMIIQPSEEADDGFMADDFSFDPYGVAKQGDGEEDEDLPFEFDEDFDDTPVRDDSPLPPLSLSDDEPGPTLPMMLDDEESPMIDFAHETPPKGFSEPETPTQPPGLAFEIDLEDDAPITNILDDIEDTAQPVADVSDEARKETPQKEHRVETLLTITRDELRPPLDEDEEEEPTQETDDAQVDTLDSVPTQPPSKKPPEATRPKRPAKKQPVEKDDEETKPAKVDEQVRPGWYEAPVQSMGKRVMEQLVALNRAVFALAFIIPLVFVIGTLITAALSRVNAAIPNPLIPSPNVFHFVGVALLLWLVACPWILRWQITWRGWRPSLWHHVRLHEEADIIILPEHLELGHWMIPWSDIESWSIYRWDDLESGMQGWMLEVTYERQNHQFSAVARDSEVWRKTRAPMAPTSERAWRVPESTFKKLMEAFGVEQTS